MPCQGTPLPTHGQRHGHRLPVRPLACMSPNLKSDLVHAPMGRPSSATIHSQSPQQTSSAETPA